ncbi:MAG: hypothetical protein WEC36_01520, partial [Phycisphaeraceae bacterium]
MTQAGALPGSTSILDGHGRVTLDLPCIACGYNLRAQPSDAACPECGHAVRRSLNTSYIAVAAHRMWFIWAWWGMLMLVVAGALTALRIPVLYQADELWFRVLLGISTLSFLPCVVGIWWLTRTCNGPVQLRFAARWLARLSSSVWALTLINSYKDSLNGYLPSISWNIVFTGVWIVTGAMLALPRLMNPIQRRGSEWATLVTAGVIWSLAISPRPWNWPPAVAYWLIAATLGWIAALTIVQVVLVRLAKLYSRRRVAAFLVILIVLLILRSAYEIGIIHAYRWYVVTEFSSSSYFRSSVYDWMLTVVLITFTSDGIWWLLLLVPLIVLMRDTAR